MKLKPIADRLVVKLLESEEEKRGGIIIPDTAKEKPEKGEVLAVGPGRMLDNGQRAALEVKAGDKVIFQKYGGHELKIDGVDHMILKEEDVMAVVE